MSSVIDNPRIPPDVQARLKDGHIGEYKIESVIGAGGMGAVFKCVDRKLKREVAVKILLSPGDQKNIARFLEEARILARLSHPNIVQVHDVGYDGHVPFFVMELVEGESLSSKLDRLGRLPVDEAEDVVTQVATGLMAVHKLGVIHRDIKAANVLVTTDGIAKLLDFGIARPVENAPKLTQQGLVMGTPSSMAPEQLRGEELDQRADVYAVGVLLYHLLAGHRPYEGEDPSALAQEQELHPPVPIRKVHAEVGEDVSRVLDKALARRRDDRYWNCEELLKDLAPDVLAHTTLHGPHLTHSHTNIPNDLSLMSRRATVARNPRVQKVAMATLAIVGLGAGLVGSKLVVKGCLTCETEVAGIEGRPAIEATPAGVFLWHDGKGFHLRARSVDTRRQLAVTLASAGGEISDVHPVDSTAADGLVVEGRRKATLTLDDAGSGTGFDFHATGCVELGVAADGNDAPELLHAGGGSVSPKTLPARYCR